jgi:hypothetical protein
VNCRTPEHRLRFALILLFSGAILLPASTPPAAPPAASKFLNLFQQFRDAGGRKGATRRHVSFSVTAGEINEYMRYALRTAPRPGIESVAVKVFPGNYISTFTRVDFDAVERWKPGSIPLLLRPFLRGRRTVWIDYRFQAADSLATFSVEKAYYNDIRLPAVFVDMMIRIVAARQPEHYDTSKPLPLPFGLRRVWTEGQAVKGEN